MKNMKKTTTIIITIAIAVSLLSMSLAYATELSIDKNGTVNAISGDMNEAKVSLSSRLIKATGYDVMPTIEKVYFEYKVPLKNEDLDEYTWKVKALVDPKNYTAKCYKAEKDGTYTLTDTAVDTGDYVYIIKGKGPFSGEKKATFSVIGLVQKVVAAKTSPKIHLGYKSFRVAVSTDGDGTGFMYESSNPKVVKVSEDGLITGLLPGREIIKVTTVGDKDYIPASVEITVTVYPAKTFYKDDFYAIKQVKNKQGEKQDNIVVYYNKQKGCDKTKVQISTSKDFDEENTITKYSKTEQRTFENMDTSKTYYVRCCGQVKVVDDKGNYEYLNGYWSSVKEIAPSEEEAVEKQ